MNYLLYTIFWLANLRTYSITSENLHFSHNTISFNVEQDGCLLINSNLFSLLPALAWSFTIKVEASGKVGCVCFKDMVRVNFRLSPKYIFVLLELEFWRKYYVIKLVFSTYAKRTSFWVSKEFLFNQFSPELEESHFLNYAFTLLVAMPVLHWCPGHSLAAVSRSSLWLWSTDSSLQGFLFLWSMDSRQHALSSCGARAELPHTIWDLPRLGIEPMSPTLAGRFFFF